jgi:DNA-binding NtrC family response regulator
MKTRVLLVDDEKEFVDQLSERLKHRDYDVTTVYSGQEALDKTRQFLYDVIVLDILMPEMDGIEALKNIKTIRPLAEVIMLTGHATVETAIEGMKLGAFDYLMKPTEIETLTEKINNAYQRKAEQEERIRMAKAQRYSASPRSVLDDK